MLTGCADADSYVTQQYLDKLKVIDALQHSLVAKHADAQALIEQGRSISCADWPPCFCLTVPNWFSVSCLADTFAACMVLL